jgi:16S rRNA (guanine(527)-N(7))-methyltransferase RsmG
MSPGHSLPLPEIQRIFDRCGLSISAPVAHSVQIYLDLLFKWNKRVNLTALEQPDQLLTTLFAESFQAAALLGMPDNPVLDIGSGAGFPGMAMKLYRPDLEVILLEPRKKRAAFLAAVRRELKLSGVTVLSRALEECRASEFTGRPAVITMRGVGHADHWIRQASALLKSRPTALLFVSENQVSRTVEALPEFHWQSTKIPWNPNHSILLGRQG